MKTIYTFWFESCKRNGHAQKAGKAGFMDGTRYLERTLYTAVDELGNADDVVFLNGNAHPFKRYPDEMQTRDGIVRGRII